MREEEGVTVEDNAEALKAKVAEVQKLQVGSKELSTKEEKPKESSVAKNSMVSENVKVAREDALPKKGEASVGSVTSSHRTSFMKVPLLIGKPLPSS